MTALVGTGAQCSLIYGDHQKFGGLLSTINGYGEQMVMAKKISLTLKNGHSPP